jgi:putative transposase
MARFARIVVPGLPHHITQRGSRRMQVFLSEDDYRLYTRLLGDHARRHALDIWAYCLMPNHVHLVVVPSREQGLARPLGQAHQRYALEINRRHRWTGHLWQERFASFPMDEPHVLAALRYVLLNPVRAGLARTAVDWPYSSARAHVLGQSDPLVNCQPGAERVDDWSAFLDKPIDETLDAFRRHGRIGRPLGSESFIRQLEEITGRRLRPRKAGRRPSAK